MTHEIQTDLAVRRVGRRPGQGPAMLFLHGLTDAWSGWPGAERQWGPRYAILTVDQRGHGTSPRFSAEQLEAHPGEVMVADAVGVLEQLGEPAVVLGHSLGGAVALAAAVRRPELVRALVLEDPAPLGPGDPQRDPSRGQDFLAGLEASIAACDDEELFLVRKEAHPDWPEDELLVTGVAERQVDREYLANGDFKPTTRWPELFGEVGVPTLVVSGDNLDEVCITEPIERGIAEIGNPHVEVVRVLGAAHCIRRERPEAYYAAVDSFLGAHG